MLEKRFSLIFLTCLCLYFASVSAEHGEENEDVFTNHLSLRKDVYDLYWKYDNETITFKVEVQTLGYIGFGVSVHGGMKGADLVIGWVKDGETYFHDRYAVKEDVPKIDEQQDWHLLSGSENGSSTTLTFTRKLSTCDIQDLDITYATTRLIWAYNDKDPENIDGLPYHGSTGRGTKSVQLMTKNLKEPELPEDAISHDFLNNKVAIPAIDTVYWCQVFKVPELAQKHHIIMYEPVIQPGNELFVHHLVGYACPGHIDDSILERAGSCFYPNMQFGEGASTLACSKVIFAWGVGGHPHYYPEHVGFPIGGDSAIKYIRLEVHYDNPDLSSEIVDSSGLRIYMTPTLRQFDSGLIQAGVSVIGDQVIPPHAKKFRSVGFCTNQCLMEAMKNQTEAIHIYAILLHTHVAGVAIKLRHFRDGKELPVIDEDRYFDFNYMDLRLLSKETTVLPTDELMVDCYYNTDNKNNVTWGGVGTNDEMCLAFIKYYPEIPLSNCETIPTWRQMLSGVVLEPEEILPNPDYPFIKVNDSKYEGMDVQDILSVQDWKDPELIEDFQNAVETGEMVIRCRDHAQTGYPSHYAMAQAPNYPKSAPDDMDEGCPDMFDLVQLGGDTEDPGKPTKGPKKPKPNSGQRNMAEKLTLLMTSFLVYFYNI